MSGCVLVWWAQRVAVRGEIRGTLGRAWEVLRFGAGAEGWACLAGLEGDQGAPVAGGLAPGWSVQEGLMRGEFRGAL